MTTLREALASKLTKKEHQFLRASFDVIGDIAIIEVSPALKKKERVIAQTLLKLLKNIKVVAVKRGGHKGKYRRQKLEVLAGEKRLQTLHKESGVRMNVDVRRCYYSPRLGTQRLRIAKLVKKGERILVAGSGIAPYPLVLAKHSKAKEIVGVEFNPVAHAYAQANVALNKVRNITLIKADVRRIRRGTFDRIIVAIPHTGVAIVPSLLKSAKKGAYLHVLDFAPEDDMQQIGKQLVAACKSKKRKCRVLRTVKAGQHAVRMYRVCVDAKLN